MPGQRASPVAFRYNLPARREVAGLSNRVVLNMAKPRENQRKRPAAAPHTGMSAAQAGRELEELNRIGIALSETRDVERLLALILSRAREITGADAGSLYLVEQTGANLNSRGQNPASGADITPRLRFRLTQ